MNSEKDTLYARWLAGEISPEELEQLRASGELAELEAIIKGADQLALPAYDVESGFEKLKRNRSNTGGKVRKMNRRRVLSIAAGFLILATAAFLFLGRDTKLIAGENQTLAHNFSQNSAVTLNAGSSLTYNKRNWANQRLVKLTGEAVFNVEKGAPFIVETSLGTIEVLGTGFNVRAWGNNLHVECYHGKVRVRNNSGETILTKNQSVNVVNGTFRDETVITHQKPLWSTGNSRFYEESLNEVFAEMERQFDIKIKTPNLLNRNFSGTFRHDNLEVALNAVCKPMGLKFEISEDNKTVQIFD